jgi:hypothetical protein
MVKLIKTVKILSGETEKTFLAKRSPRHMDFPRGNHCQPEFINHLFARFWSNKGNTQCVKVVVQC